MNVTVLLSAEGKKRYMKFVWLRGRGRFIDRLTT